jgi:hypothetical protein
LRDSFIIRAKFQINKTQKSFCRVKGKPVPPRNYFIIAETQNWPVEGDVGGEAKSFLSDALFYLSSASKKRTAERKPQIFHQGKEKFH